MEFTTLLNSAGSLVTGHVLGSAAGRSRYAQIRSGATNLVRHPKVQQVACDLVDRAKSNAHRLPDPAAHAVHMAATTLQDNLSRSTVPDQTVVPTPLQTQSRQRRSSPPQKCRPR